MKIKQLMCAATFFILGRLTYGVSLKSLTGMTNDPAALAAVIIFILGVALLLKRRNGGGRGQ